MAAPTSAAAAPATSSRLARALALAALVSAAHGQGVGGRVLKKWNLSLAMPIEPAFDVDGSFAGPRGVVHAVPHGGGTCHEEVCNCFTSEPPHDFHFTWCASTAGSSGIGCSLDVGYRSQEGATHGRLGYSLAGLNASASSFVWVPVEQVFRKPAMSTFAFNELGKNGAKNIIDTVYSLAAADGAGNNLPLGLESGFCCRAEFSGGKTVTGTIYVGDLEVREGAAAPSVSPSASPTLSTTSTTSASPSPTSTTSVSETGSPAAAAANAAAPEASVPTSVFSGVTVGAVLLGSALTLAALQLAKRCGGAGAAGASLASMATGAGAGAGSAAARERASLLGRVAH